MVGLLVNIPVLSIENVWVQLVPIIWVPKLGLPITGNSGSSITSASDTHTLSSVTTTNQQLTNQVHLQAMK
jgi:hypothetical protein